MDFNSAIRVGNLHEVIEVTREKDQAPIVPLSDGPRGLALKSLRVTRNWDGLWGLLGKSHEIYFLSVTFDISEEKPVILPPKAVPESAVHRIKKGEIIEFTLGDGAPIFPPREIQGGLITYITICEADDGTRHVGEVMGQVHEQLEKDDSLVEVLKKMVTNPSQTLVDEVLSAATAALQPIATILKASKDDYIALFSGVFAAKGPWQDKLTASQGGTTIELVEL